jgi:hypothetical protein
MSSPPEIKNTTSKTNPKIPEELFKNYTPISIIYNGIGIFVALSFIGAINFISIQKVLTQNLIGGNETTGLLNNKNILTLNNFIMFLIVASILFSYIFFVYYKIILNGKNNTSAAIIILFCISTIMGITYISTSPIIHQFVNIIKVFENTVGYFVVNTVNSSKIRTVLDIFFSHKRFSTNQPFPEMTVSYNFILSVLSLDNFKQIISLLEVKDELGDETKGDSRYDFNISTIDQILKKIENDYTFGRMNDRIKIELKPYIDIIKGTDPSEKENAGLNIKKYCEKKIAEYIILKNFIGQLCWVFIASLITILVSIKYLSASR